jgi:hypothetical protein
LPAKALRCAKVNRVTSSARRAARVIGFRTLSTARDTQTIIECSTFEATQIDVRYGTTTSGGANLGTVFEVLLH